MKQSSFSLADVLTVLTAIGFGYICFLGYNFHSLGNISHSIILSLVIVLLLAGTALIAKLLKRTTNNFKKMLSLEIGVLILFTVLTAYFAYFPFNHYFTISNQKYQIQYKIQQSITHSQNMFINYEQYSNDRLNNYRDTLADIAKNKKEHYKILFNQPQLSEQQQINIIMLTFRSLLFPSNYSDTINKDGLKEVAHEWLTGASSINNKWKPISMVNVFKEIENNSNSWKNQMVAQSTIHQTLENPTDFNYDLTSTEDIKTILTTLKNPSLLSIILALAAYILMLLSWFVTKRSSKFYGSLTLAHYEIEL